MFRIAAGTALLALLPSIAQAGPSDYVYTPAVTYGERELDFKAGSWKTPGGDRLSAASIGYGLGVTQRWFTEFYVKYERPGGEGTRFDAWEWENKFQLTETGEYPVDVGFVVELEHPRERSEGNELRFGPLFQAEKGKLQLNANLLFERHYGAEPSQPMEMGYQWQTKYRWKPEFEFGVQGFGEVGPWNHWAPAGQRTHRMGPAVFGKFELGNRQAVRYNAALLLGAATSAPAHTFRLQVEYEY